MLQPQIIRACLAILSVTTSAAFWASETVMSGPPTTLIRAPFASARLISPSKGEFRASSIAFSMRSSGSLSSDSPMPTKATPPSFMTVMMSL